jgi:hypothetical protein
MASYQNNPAGVNPFFTNPPLVMVVRHVRVTGAGEIVAEDPNTLPRYMVRAVGTRTYPQRQTPVPVARNIPNAGNQKTTF